MSPPDHARWLSDVDRFNQRDFDALRGMLADDVRLELVNRLSAGGERVREYYGRYAGTRWQARLGWVDGMPAALVFDADDTEGRPVYFVLLEWSDGRIAKIRDFLFARYVMEDAEISVA